MDTLRIIRIVSSIIILLNVSCILAHAECKQNVVIDNKSNSIKFGAIIDPPKGSDYSVWFPLVPRSIAFDSKGNIIVGDSVKYKIVKFNSDGKYIGSFPLQKPIKSKKLSHIIQDIATDKYDNIYVINSLEFRVEIYKSNGKYINSINYFDDEIQDLNTKKPKNKYSPKNINVDVDGNVYLYSPDISNKSVPSSGAVYSKSGKLIQKGVIVTLKGKGIKNYDENKMVYFNGYYLKFDSYAPDKKLPGKTVDKITLEDIKGNTVAICDNLQIAKDEDSEIFKTDKFGNIYTFDYYNTLNVIRIVPGIKK